MVATIPDSELDVVLRFFGDRSFTTLDFIDELRKRYPGTWARLEEEYGSGGKGAGKYYSAYSRASQVLNKRANIGLLVKNDYEEAPRGWGSPVIRRWNDRGEADGPFFPNEVGEEDEHWEGSVLSVLVNRFERDPYARKKCIQHHKPICQVCHFDFEARYGELGAGFIHVHHIVPISRIGEKYKIDPINDLVPVCPNCHAMLHRKAVVLEIEELRKLLK